MPYVPPRLARRYGAESTQSMPERRTPEETDDQPANAHGYQRTTKYKRMSTYHEAVKNSESSGEEAQETKTKKPGVTIHQSPHLEVPEKTRDHVRFQAAPASMPDYQYPRTVSAPDYEYPRTDISYTPNPGFRSRFDSVSGRRHSERSRPARYHENRYYREPHLGYQYPYSARRQQPYDTSDFPDGQSSGW